jgi:diguanylate cyclase (GGDEF)-like protein
MRYKKQADEFYHKKLLLVKSAELLRVIKELEEKNARLSLLSQTDALTSVLNRLGFEKKIREEWERCKSNSLPLSLIIIDIDFFKRINDRYGHQAGDECIRRIADILSAYTENSSNVVTRYGGDEFAVLLSDIDKEKAAETAERLREKVEHLAIPQAKRLADSQAVTISLGVSSVIPSDASTIYEFIRNADIALYEAKKERNITVVA